MRPDLVPILRPGPVGRQNGRSHRRPELLDALVMTVLERSNWALGAYDIAEHSARLGSRISVAQVYRVLERLMARGRVHRVELLAAWLPARGEQLGFLVCRRCRSVQRFPASVLLQELARLCRAAGFVVSSAHVEASGLCAECRSGEDEELTPHAKGKDVTMMTRARSLLAVMMTAGAMIAAQPVDAAERKPGALYDNDGKPLGTIGVIDTPKGVLLRIDVRGLPPGWHGVHFHEKADCGGAAFANAGGHVHSEKPIVHGFLVEGANDAGDLSNIHVHADGSVTVELYSTLVSADGRDGRPALRDADGSALVTHANPDDYTTQPIGGAGDRIACAVIR